LILPTFEGMMAERALWSPVPPHETGACGNSPSQKQSLIVTKPIRFWHGLPRLSRRRTTCMHDSEAARQTNAGLLIIKRNDPQSLGLSRQRASDRQFAFSEEN
jgi:hypothetical protein